MNLVLAFEDPDLMWIIQFGAPRCGPLFLRFMSEAIDSCLLDLWLASQFTRTFLLFCYLFRKWQSANWSSPNSFGYRVLITLGRSEPVWIPMLT